MSFVKRALSVLNADCKMDTVVTSTEVIAGEVIEGIIYIYGGEKTQKLKEVTLSVYTDYKKESRSSSSRYGKVRLNKEIIKVNKSVAPNETLEIPFSFILSERAPITVGRSSVYVDSELGITNRLDPKDKDYLDVKPNSYIENVFTALQNIGFQLRESENVYQSSKQDKFVQLFDFAILGDKYADALDELEVVFTPTEDGYEFLLKIERQAIGLRGLSAQSSDGDVSNVLISMSKEKLAIVSEVETTLAGIINQYV